MAWVGGLSDLPAAGDGPTLVYDGGEGRSVQACCATELRAVAIGANGDSSAVEASDGWLVGKDGKQLPVHGSSVRFVKEFGSWSHYKAGTAFNSLFWRALRSVGWSDAEHKAPFGMWLRYAKEFGLSSFWARLVWARERGVLGDGGWLFLRPPERGGVIAETRGSGTDSPKRKRRRVFVQEDWDMIMGDALSVVDQLPDEAEVLDELRWVVLRLREWPEFKRAPSRFAVKLWLAANDPGGAESFERELLRLTLRHRLDEDGRKTEKQEGNEEDREATQRLAVKLFGG